jgi:5-methylcytosine-specific restriction endonuclease McrA
MRRAFSKREFMKLAHRQEFRCAACRELLHWDSQIDHIVPWCLCHDDSYTNLQVLCPNCHADKTGNEASRIRRVRHLMNRCRAEDVLVCWVCESVVSPYFETCWVCAKS